MGRIWLGKLKGGLAIATLFAAALFGAMSGSSLAGSLVMGRVAYPEMRKLGYKMSLAAGVVSVGGTLDLLIPPSMAFIMIGIMAELDISQLYMGAIIPGIVVTVFYMVTVWIWCKFDPQLAPIYQGKFTWKERLVSIRLSWPVVVLFLLVMGGMYAGVFTSTEAGAVGALGALVISLAKRQMSAHGFWKSLKDTARTLSMYVILLTGATLFGAFMAVTQIPNTFGNFLLGLGISKMGYLRRCRHILHRSRYVF